MKVEEILDQRAQSKCELCSSTEELKVYEVPPESNGTAEQSVLTCSICFEQLEDSSKISVPHWRCLNDSMWNPTPAVQVLVWRMLNKLKEETWPLELMDMMYMEEETKHWAKANLDTDKNSELVHKDVNGNVLEAGDTVTLIKDLKVKGASFTAKQGTAVRRISLVSDNPEHIEGKIDGQRIVILTQYVKKQK